MLRHSPTVPSSAVTFTTVLRKESRRRPSDMTFAVRWRDFYSGAGKVTDLHGPSLRPNFVDNLL